MSEHTPPSQLGNDLRALARHIPATLRAHAERMAVQADELTAELERAEAESKRTGT